MPMARPSTVHARSAAALLILALIVVGTQPTIAAEAGSFAAARASITIPDLKRHAAVLASDALEGREAASRGGKAAAAYLHAELKKPRVRPAGDDGTFLQEFGDDYRNLLAVVPGSDPVLKHEIVVIGAHYDHVGYGAVSNSHGPLGQIHNGADDNASGVSGVLELAEAFSLLNPPPKRTVLFAFWDAEERGLLGSQHWVAHPTVPLAGVRLSINVDMIGRLRRNTLQLSGVQTGAGLRRMVAWRNRDTDLTLDFQPRLQRDSDHWSFYTAGIPALFLETGEHEDYHRPSDDAHKLALEGMQRITRFVFDLATEAAQRPDLPPFRHEPETAATLATNRTAARPPSRLGISWDVASARGGVIRITQVAGGSAAERAGIAVGDRLLEVGAWKNGSTDDLVTTVLMSDRSVPVVVERNGEPRSLVVTLSGEPVRLGFSWQRDPYEPQCVVCSEVVPFSPCFRAGLQAGDRVLQVSGRDFASEREFRQCLNDSGAPLELLIERSGRMRTLRIPTQRTTRELQPLSE